MAFGARRWTGSGHLTPKPAAAQAIADVVRAGWQPRVRRAAERDGFVLHTSAQFGFAGAAGSTDDPRRRLIVQRLFAARDVGASEAGQAVILAVGLREHCFRDGDEDLRKSPWPLFAPPLGRPGGRFGRGVYEVVVRPVFPRLAASWIGTWWPLSGGVYCVLSN